MHGKCFALIIGTLQDAIERKVHLESQAKAV